MWLASFPSCTAIVISIEMSDRRISIWMSQAERVSSVATVSRIPQGVSTILHLSRRQHGSR